MDRAERLLLFADVVSTGSFSAAARQRRLTRSVVSKQMARLEEELNVRLINRTTRSLSLTEVGKALYAHSRRLREHLDETEAMVASFRDSVTGLLRITCARHFGHKHVRPVVARFLADHPEASVELRLDDAFVDLVAEGYDLAIRITQPGDSGLIARKLLENEVVMLASPAYLARCGKPRNMADLEEHGCVVYGFRDIVVDRWQYRVRGQDLSVRVRPVLTVNDGMAMMDAIRDGMGIGLAPRFMLGGELETGTLTEILPQIQMTSYAPVYAVYPAREYLAPKTRTFLEYLVAHIETLDWRE